MIGGRKDCRAGKRCHPPPRPNEKTNGEGSRQLLSVRRYVFYIGKNSQASAKAPAIFAVFRFFNKIVLLRFGG